MITDVGLAVASTDPMTACLNVVRGGIIALAVGPALAGASVFAAYHVAAAKKLKSKMV
jgi:hypothetical protein